MSDERRQLPSGHPHLCDCSASDSSVSDDPLRLLDRLADGSHLRCAGQLRAGATVAIGVTLFWGRIATGPSQPARAES